MYLSVAGVPIDEFQGAGEGVHRRALAGPPRGKTIDPYAIYGAQAAQVLLDAIAASDGTRTDVIAKMFDTEVDGRAARLVRRSTTTVTRRTQRAPWSASRSTRRPTSSTTATVDLAEAGDGDGGRRRLGDARTQSRPSGGRALPFPAAFRFRVARHADRDATRLQRLRASSIVDLIGLTLLALVAALALRQVHRGSDASSSTSGSSGSRTAPSTGSSRSATRSSTGSCS